jgi:CheY-like chemotaxis protein
MQLPKFKDNISGPIIDHLSSAPRYDSAEGITILLIDDEPIVTDICELMLREMGHRVLKAYSGSEGIRVYEAHQNQIDLIISDYNMPAMNGQQVIEKLRVKGHQVKVLLSTGGLSVEDEKSAIARGFSGFLRKPFDMGTLSAKISESLN